VLLDIPRSLGKEWLEPGEAIYAEDLEAAEMAMHVRVEEGDILLVRTGRHLRREKAGPAQGLAGIHATALPWLHSRGVAVLGSDGVSDVMPSGMEGGGGLPVHNIIIPSMGVHLIDNMALDELAETCDRLDRYEFMLTLAPLKLLRGTASPVNPIALF
jgi:kynurenine formamidase